VEATARTESPSGRKRKARYEGIVLRHARGCRSRTGGRCSCTPSYQAQVWSARERKTIRKTFPTLAAAHSWRHESQVALRQGTIRSTSHLTLEEAAEAWLSAAEAGIVRTRTGEAYSTLFDETSHPLEILVELDRASHITLRRQLELQLRELIACGAFEPTARLPSTRVLAVQLGVSRAS